MVVSLQRKIMAGVSLLIIILAAGWWVWQIFHTPQQVRACNPEKITLNVNGVARNGEALPRNIGVAIDYEFCIPYSDQALQEVHQIDPAISCQNGPSGHIGCTDDEYLCTGSTTNKNSEDVLCRLSLLDSIKHIEQAFWE
jgi:hypothetical protein